MEKKLCLWISLIVGIPAIRVIEVVSLSRSTSGASQVDYVRHLALGLIVGIGCAMAVKIMRLEGKRLSILPVLAVGYAALLLGVTYPKSLFAMPSSYVMSLLMMDMVAWIIAVGGATMIGAIATRPRSGGTISGSSIPRLDRA